jgi:cytochrome c oxidase subunit 2
MPPPVRRSPLIAAAACLAFGLAVAGVADAHVGVGPPADSPNAGGIQDTYYLILGITGVIFLLVEGLLVWFVIRYRARNRLREVEGPQVRGNTRLEIAWTVAPVLVLAAIAGYVAYKLPGIRDVPEAAAAERLEIEVEGRQFYWQFTYPNGAIAIDRLVVPVGHVVELDVTAPTHDVLHSWWIPRLGPKIDAIPGERHSTWFRAEKTGVYRGQCAEFCGVFHGLMLAQAEVVEEQEFTRWLERQRGPESQLGREEWEGACAKCHGLEGEGGFGPAIAGNPLLTDEEGLTELLRDGRGKMPAVGRGWSERQLEALLGYLRRNLSGGG